ncbi:MAG: histidine kinase, partial [Rhodobacteraceae bacterium]|nr:histidine kinase [Paracoccaceae bacterium]
VLIQPIVVHRVCQLIWFRGPVTRTVHWAGEPKKELDAEGRLTPRKSFESWTQEHNDQSIPWNVAELQSAREIFTEFLDIMASQLLLKEENENLRSFAYTAAHDLKAPLRGINMALEWMSEDGFDPEAVRETHALALKSSEKLSELAEGLLELVILENQLLKRKPVDLSKVVAEVQDLLAGQIQAEHAQITVGRLPVIESNEQMMQRLFLNLLSNALKYRHPDRSPVIEITSVLFAEDVLEISVADNGLGVDLKFADKIFQPMERAHGNTAVEGSGLGLAICQRIAHKHGGTIALDLERQENGARFVIRIPQHADYLHG